MLAPKPVRAPTLLLVLLAGVAIAFSAALLLKMWFPRLAPLLFIAVSATWLYAGWRLLRDENVWGQAVAPPLDAPENCVPSRLRIG